MRALAAFVSVAGFLSSTTSLSAKTVEPLKPSSPWNVNYADDSCRLARTFGTGDDMVSVLFDRYGPAQSFKLTVAGKPFRNLINAGRGTLQFGPNEQMQTIDFFVGELGKERPAMIFKNRVRFDAAFHNEPATGVATGTWGGLIDARPLSAERIEAVSLLTITKPLHNAVRLALGPMGAAFAASDKCLTDLVKHWGLDPDRLKQASKQVLPINDPLRWLTSDDYPRSAAFRGEQGIVHFRLNIDETGKPSACHIQQSTRPPEFDEVVCRKFSARARFSPALDKSGAPMPSVYLSAVIFQMP